MPPLVHRMAGATGDAALDQVAWRRRACLRSGAALGPRAHRHHLVGELDHLGSGGRGCRLRHVGEQVLAGERVRGRRGGGRGTVGRGDPAELEHVAVAQESAIDGLAVEHRPVATAQILDFDDTLIDDESRMATRDPLDVEREPAGGEPTDDQAVLDLHHAAILELQRSGHFVLVDRAVGWVRGRCDDSMRPVQPAVVAEAPVDVEHLVVRFGRGARAVDALAGVDLRCATGEIVGVLGPNGSGKTTLLRVLAGDLLPTSGRARVLGGAPTHRAIVERVGYQPEGPLPFPHLSATQLMLHLATLGGVARDVAKERSARWLTRLDLQGIGRRGHGTFSTGQRRRLALAIALAHDPDVVLLDEPTAGLDPDGSLLVLEILAELRARGAVVLLASHHLQEIERVCDRVLIVREGNVAAEGSLDELLGTDEERLELRGLPRERRSELEATARACGAEVLGWSRGRRHLFALFRDLGRREP